MNYNIQTLEKLIKNIQWFDLPARLKAIFNKLPTGSSEPSYKVYTALLTQSGTNAPVATVLENTLGFNIIWTYNDIGIYNGTVSTPFDLTKTTLDIQSSNFFDYGQKNGIDIYEGDETTIWVGSTYILLGDSTFINHAIVNCKVEIRVYN